MMYPRGRWFFQPLVHAIRTANVCTISLFSWERGSEGHEGELRRFCRAFRSLPAVPAKEFGGRAEVVSGPVADESLWVRAIGGRVAVANDSSEARTVRITLPVHGGQAVYEYATQRRLAGAAMEAVTVEVALDAFDLKVLGRE